VFLYSFQDLPHLVPLGHAPVRLKVHVWKPEAFVKLMGSRLALAAVTDGLNQLDKARETDAHGVGPGLLENVLGLDHGPWCQSWGSGQGPSPAGSGGASVPVPSPRLEPATVILPVGSAHLDLGLPRRHIPFPEVGPGTLWYQKTRKVMGVVPLPLPLAPTCPPPAM